MNITFLLGNGFDIGLGLRTGYEQFYTEYCKPNPTDNENIVAFKRMLSERNSDEVKKIIDWADFESAFGEHSADFKIAEKARYIERFEHFVMAFNEYLEDEVKSADFSDSQRIGEMMNNAVKTYFHIREADQETLQQLYSKLSTDRVYSFVSFNYTSSVDECATALKAVLAKENHRKIGSVLHVHGYIEEHMIMGVNDASQIKNPDFASDPDVLSEIVKPRQNSESRTAYDARVTSLIKASDIICIYGMSIGSTDKKWWALIANWLAGNQNRALVILTHDKKYNKRFPFMQQRVVNGMIERFLSFSEQKKDIQTELSRRIYVGGNHDVFAMNLCKKAKSVSKKDVVSLMNEAATRTIDPSVLTSIINSYQIPPDAMDKMLKGTQMLTSDIRGSLDA